MIPTFGLPLGETGLLLHFCAALVMSLRLIYRKLNVTMTLAWILIIVFLPIAGLVLYWLFGSRKLGRKRQLLGSKVRQYYIDQYDLDHDSIDPDEIETTPHFNDLARAIESLTGFAPIEGNEIELLPSDAAIFDAMERDIEAAENTCFAEFYIIHPKGAPIRILRAFERAARRGVNVKLSGDAIGSRPFFKSEWPARLEKAGVELTPSLGVSLIKTISKRTDLRNHRKILVLDQKIGYIGSCNLTDPIEFKPDDGHWIDLMARVSGPFAESLSVVLAADFIFDKSGTDFTQSDLAKFPPKSSHPRPKGPAVAQLIPSGPEMGDSVIYEAIVAAIFAASEKITIVTPYFVPDEAITLALANACRRGLEVTLILPAKGDSIMVTFASNAAFDTLLKAGVKIGYFHGGMLHTKALVIDDDISFIGTVNMDLRSFHLNLEVTMVVYDERINAEMREIISTYLTVTSFIDAEEWAKRGRWQMFRENVFRLMSPLL